MRTLRAVYLDGVNTDSLGHYLAGLGLLAVASQKWPTIRACWRNGRFAMLSDQITGIDEIKQYLLTEWKPRSYERWWSAAQKADTKAKSSLRLWRERNGRDLAEIKLLDAHLVGLGRNCFNPVLGTGGNIGKRDLSKAWKDAIKLLSKAETSGWLDATLTGNANCGMPGLASGGTWFVFANKMFNSGQSWYREGELSPWSLLLAMEGAFLLIGGVNRRLGSRTRPYAVFPFVSDPSQPESDGEIGLSRAEFWAPLWGNPATIQEVESLFQRGMARMGGRAAKAPHEFAVAALAAGVDAGITEFARFKLRQTTSSQVFEAIPREHVVAAAGDATDGQGERRAAASTLLVALLESSWLDRLPFEPRDSKQKGRFVGLRGPIETAIVRLGERPDDPTRWQELLLKLAHAQLRIDRNKDYRERCAPLRPLAPDWFKMAWPQADGIPVEIEMAKAIASIGWQIDVQGVDLPLYANVFGVEIAKKRSVRITFPKARTARAVWSNGTPQQVLLEVAHRRLIDADRSDSEPFAATSDCSADAVFRLLRNDGSINLEEVVRWIPPLALIDWSRAKGNQTAGPTHAELDGTSLLYALARPLFHAHTLRVWNSSTRQSESLFPQRLEPTSGLLRRVFNLLRFNSIDEAIQVLRDRYLAAGRNTIVPPSHFIADGELVAAALLIPVSDRAVTDGLRRWFQPSSRRPN